jgi:hypothetical protein
MLRSIEMHQEEEIRLIAYHIWREHGCPDGRDCEFWFKAEAIKEEQDKKALETSSNAGNKSIDQSNKSGEARGNSIKRRLKKL